MDHIQPPPDFLGRLPDEVVQHILLYCTPSHIIKHIQLVCKRFDRLSSDPLLWRHHCKVEFKYWDVKHQIRKKFRGDANVEQWRNLYAYRIRTHKITTRLLDSIIADQVDRISKYKQIADIGYDAKDTLLLHCHSLSTEDDYLARRYYATSVLDHIHRQSALENWMQLLGKEDVSYEHGLASFDLFILHDRPGDHLEISDIFDGLEMQFYEECPNFSELSTRRKALLVVSWLRAHNLVSTSLESRYRDLRNSYVGMALQDDEHPSLPLISVVIFCALAQRLGLNARACGIPAHAHAMVFAQGYTLDGCLPRASEEELDIMYLDPYSTNEEIPLHSLRRMLTGWGIDFSRHNEFLIEAPLSFVILRTSRNIIATVQRFRNHAAQLANNVGATFTATTLPDIQLYGNPFIDLELCFYSAVWANYIFGTPAEPGVEGTTRDHFIPLILERFESLFPMDASIIEQFIIPHYHPVPGADMYNIRDTIRVVKAADQTPKQVRSRASPAVQGNVNYKVGQVFRHKRYNYQAVITGWDMECGQNSTWIARNNVDALSRGRKQSFYHVLVEDSSFRYVAEENIQIDVISDPAALMGLAGRFFKRWDEENRVFVSNIRDEYPDN